MDRPTDELIQRMLAASAGRADETARRLIASASATAEAEVCSLLTAALKAALLQRAVAQLEACGTIKDSPAPSVEIASPPSPPPHETGASPPACYLYGITRAGAELDLSDQPAVDPAFPLYTVRHESLEALVSRVSAEEFGEAMSRRIEDVQWIEQKARTHDQIIRHAAKSTTIIPLRFGTVAASEDDVRQILIRHLDELERSLGWLEGKAEWGVKIALRGIRGNHNSGATDDEHSGKRHNGPSGKAFLLERKRRTTERARRRRAALERASSCHAELAALADAAVTLPAGRAGESEPALSAAYLVRDHRSSSFRQLVHTLSQRWRDEGLVFELTGPWPAYNFVRTDLSAGREMRA